MVKIHWNVHRTHTHTSLEKWQTTFFSIRNMSNGNINRMDKIIMPSSILIDTNTKNHDTWTIVGILLHQWLLLAMGGNYGCLYDCQKVRHSLDCQFFFFIFYLHYAKMAEYLGILRIGNTNHSIYEMRGIKLVYYDKFSAILGVTSM